MKIFEITRPDLYTAIERLERAGYVELGSGSFGTVLARPDKPFIVKLFGTNDQAYLQYLHLISKTQNPHFPTLRGKPIKITNHYYGIQLERLTRPANQKMFNYLIDKSENYARMYRDLAHSEKYRYRVSKTSSDEQTQMLHPDINSYGSNLVAARQELERFEQEYPEMAKALRLIVEYIVIPLGTAIDMHEGNFMMRGSTLVITDPVAHASNDSIDIIPDRKPVKQMTLPMRGGSSGRRLPFRRTPPSPPPAQPPKPYWQQTQPQRALPGLR